MLSESHFDRLTVVLVSPRNPLNIGAAARTMANFGFSRLAVVAPYEPHWREAKSAVQAEDLLQNARCMQCLSEAVADCTLVLGTGTITKRKPEQSIVQLPNLSPIIEAELARGGRIAIVFGPEKRGLTREDLSLCHHLVEIPTHPRQPSMNLAQAVAVCLYEIAARSESLTKNLGAGSPNSGARENAADNSAAPPKSSKSRVPHPRDASVFVARVGDAPAAASDLELLADVVEETMTAANYSPPAMRNANRHDLHLLLRRLALTQNDAKRILGLFRRILWSLRHRVGPD